MTVAQDQTHVKPVALIVTADSIPDELRRLPQWLVWRYGEPRSDGKYSKPPRIARNPYPQRDGTDPAHWSPFDMALRAYEAAGAALDGIGFALCDADGLVAGDLDDAYDPDGELTQWAADIVTTLDTYTERSPSGKGIRMFMRGAITSDRRKVGAPGGGEIEFYAAGRYVTITGDHVPGTPTTIQARQAELDQVYARYFPPVAAQTTPTTSGNGYDLYDAAMNAGGPRATGNGLSDADVLTLAAGSAKSGAQFMALWSGDWSGYPSRSEADLALCNDLTFWTGGSRAQVDRLFRASPLWRPKWDQKHGTQTYGEYTIDKSFEGRGPDDFYRGPAPGPAPGPARPAAAAPVSQPGASTGGKTATQAARVVDVPPMPAGALLEPDLGSGVGAWVDLYTGYARAVSPMTPALFHQSAALWLVSAVIARRLVLPMAWGHVYPNLFIAWVARSTLFRKTTGLKVARDILRERFGFLSTPEDFTVEAMVSEMAGMDPPNLAKMSQVSQTRWTLTKDYAAQRAWSLDEFSGLLASAGKDYQQGFIEALLRFYDCETQYTRSTRGQGRLQIDNAYLTFLGATTPAAIAEHMTNQTLWGNGWWPRFALLTPETGKPAWEVPQDVDRPPALVQALDDLHRRLPAGQWLTVPTPRPVLLGAGVFDAFGRFNKALSYDLLTPPLDGRLYASYGRLPEMALKVAALLAALDWPAAEPSPTIELPHLARAESIVEDWRHSLHRAIKTAAEVELDDFLARVLRHLSRYGATGQTANQLQKRHIVDKTPSEIEEALEQLEQRGDIERHDPPRPAGGRPTKYWRVLGY